MADNTITPDLSPLGTGGGPTFSTDASSIAAPQWDQYSGAKPEDFQKELGGWVGRLAQEFDPGSAKNQQLAKHLEALSYTPEQRTQDLYNKAFGIKTSSVVDANNNPVGEPVKTGHDWLRFGLQNIGEAGRAIQSGIAVAHGGQGYTPAMERFREQALKEYQAEATPAVRELLYENQNQRAAMGDLQRMMGTYNQSVVAQGKLEVARQRADVGNYLATLKGKLEPAQYNEMLARTQLASSTEDLNKIKGDLDTAQKGYVEAQTAKAKAGGDEGVLINRMMAKDPTLTFNDAVKKLYAYKAMVGARQEPIYDANQILHFYNNKTGAIWTPPNPSMGGGQIPYGTPAGHTAQNDPLLSPAPMMKPLPDRDPAMTAMRAYQVGHTIQQLIDNLPDDKLGDIKGMIYKGVDNHFANADPRYKELFFALDSYASMASSYHGFRNKGFVDEMRDAAADTKTNKSAMKAVLAGFQETAAQTMRAYPGLKNAAMNAGYNYPMLDHVWGSGRMSDLNSDEAIKAAALGALEKKK